MAAVLRGLPAVGSKFAELDRELLTVIDTGADPADRAGFTDLLCPLTGPEAFARGQLLARLDELADADPDDPRVAALAGDLAAHLPEEMASAMVTSLDDTGTSHWLEAMSQELSVPQAETFRLLVIMLKERGRC
jgi:hypothetical protein